MFAANSGKLFAVFSGKVLAVYKDAAEEMKRLEEVERARKEQEKLNQNRDDDEAGTVVAM